MFRCFTLPKKTLKTIANTNNTYLVQVKGNTSKLFRQVSSITETNNCITSHIFIEKASGRTDHRAIEIYQVLDGQITGDWKECSIQTIVKVCRWDSTSTEKKRANRKSKNYKNGKATNGVHYYILNKPFYNAEKLGRMIRNHWKIENELHWVKDVYLKEDKMTIVKEFPAALLASLNNIALNQIRKTGEKPRIIFFEKIVNNIPLINKIIRT